MDTQLLYIIGFAVITLVALVASLSVKFERRDNDHHKEENTEVIKVSNKDARILEVINTTLPNNPVETTGGGGIAPHVDTDGRTKITYTRTGSGDNLSFTRSEEYPNLESINSLFSHKPYIKMNWRGNSVLALNSTRTNSQGVTYEDSYLVSTAQRYNSHLKHQRIIDNSVETITATYNGTELPLRMDNNRLSFTSFDTTYAGRYNFSINNKGILVDGIYKRELAVVYSTSYLNISEINGNRLVAVSSGGGNLQLMFVVIPDDNIQDEKNINRLEYFGITTETNFPLSINSLKGFTISDAGTVEPFEQFLGSSDSGISNDIRKFGLFAKTHTTAPIAGDPSITDPSGYTGFTGVDDHIRISFIDSLPNNSTMNLPSLWDDSEVTHPQPKYSIYVVLDKDIHTTTGSFNFKDTNNVKGTQTIVIFGSRYYSNNGHADYGTSLARDHPNITGILDNDKLVDNLYNNYTLDFILTNDNPIYLGHGAYNMNGVVFMKFNTSGDASYKRFTVEFGTGDQARNQGWTYGTSNEDQGLDLIPVFYNSVDTSVNLTTQHFRNYYRWDGGTTTYTHYKYNGNAESNSGWVVVP
jgi:hypothetical protein